MKRVTQPKPKPVLDANKLAKVTGGAPMPEGPPGGVGGGTGGSGNSGGNYP